MKLDKKILLPTLLFVLVFSFASWTIGAQKAKEEEAKLDIIRTDTPIVFYYGKTCPHCKLVEKYIDENQIREKVKFSQKEVYGNKDNAREAVGRAEQCGIAAKDLGVPFLWDGEKCYVGDEQIIAFFKAKAQEAGQNTGNEAAIFYYNNNCPHCKAVEEFMAQNQVEGKVALVRKETSDRSIAEEAIAKETACGIGREAMGVPMLFAGGKCYMGEDEIINFFKGKINAN
jgi:glutaredoxin